MSYIFKMPDVGEGIAEGEIVTWFVKVGDVVTEDQPLMEIQNDKLVQEVPSPVAGTVTKILVEAGTVSTVGDDLIEISTGGSAPVAAAPEATAPVAAAAPSTETFIFNLPDVGEGLAEAEVVKWFVKEGDTITEDAPMLEIQTDKLVQEVPAPVAGTVLKINVQEGVVATVGQALVEIAPSGSAPAAATTAPAGA